MGGYKPEGSRTSPLIPDSVILTKRFGGVAAWGRGGGAVATLLPPDERRKMKDVVRHAAVGQTPICNSWFSLYLSDRPKKLSERYEATSLYKTPRRLTGL